MDKLTRTEAETLAVMLNSAGSHMAQARSGGKYVWDNFTGGSPWADMLQGFYEIVPAEYEIYV